MAGLDFSFLFKRPASKKEMAAYENWAFPYGQAQRDKLEALMHDIRPKREIQTLMFSFLTCKEMLEDLLSESGDTELTYDAINQLSRRSKYCVEKNEFEIVVALVLADAKVGEDCVYPTAEEILTQAEKLKALHHG